MTSGGHLPTEVDAASTVGLDVTSIMTLGLLGRLDEAIDHFATTAISPQTLSLLFAERRFLRVQQPSLVDRARRVQALLASGALKTVPSRHDAARVQEFGVELASLLAHAAESDGVVARPAPVRRVGTLSEENADLGEQEPRMADMTAVLSFLKSRGRLSASAEAAAGSFVEQVDDGWPSGGALAPDKPIFLDSLAVSYLDLLGLLEALADAAPSLHVHESTAADAAAWIRSERHAAKLEALIDGIRTSPRRGLASGKVRFCARRPPDGAARPRRGGDPMPTLDLLSDLSGIDVVAVDDRFFNKGRTWDDTCGHVAAVANSIDLLAALQARAGGRAASTRDSLLQLRSAGFFATPLADGELADCIAAAVDRGGHVAPTPELRAIRDSVDLPLIRDIPIAGDAPWLNGIRLEAVRAIRAAWAQDTDAAARQAQAEWALSALPSPLAWRLADDDDSSWAIARKLAASQASLVIAGCLTAGAAATDYRAWLEDRSIPTLMQSDPELWDQVVDHLKSFAARLADDDEQAAEGA